MLEILFLLTLCKSIGRMARSKGRIAIGYQILVILFWFLGEIAGAFVGGMLLIAIHGENWEKYYLLAYIPAIICAALATWFVFLIVAGLSDKSASTPGVGQPVRVPADLPNS